MKNWILHIVFLSLVVCACKQSKKQLPIKKISMGLTVLDSVSQVGSEISLTIENKDAYKGPASLLVSSHYKNSKIDFTISESSQQLIVKAELMEEVGVYNYYMMINDQLVARTQSRLEAGEITDPIEVFTGPNTIWVNDIQETMVVALPKDQYDNPVSENETVSYNTSMPTGNTSKKVVSVGKQVAPLIVSSQNKKGEAYIGVSSKDASAKEQKVNVISLWPTEVFINIEEVLPYADHREFMRLKTKVMRDRNNELIPDGTHVMFRSTTEEGIAKYNAYSIDGVASCYIRNPSSAGKMSIDAVVGGRLESNQIIQDFESNVKEVNYKWEGTSLKVGPITSFLGQYIPDGTRVKLKDGDQEIIKETEDGKVIFEIQQLIEEAELSINDFTLMLKKER